MTYKIRIANYPASYSECHSETQVKNREDAIAYLWALAKQNIPQYGVVWLPMGVEPMTNQHMFQADPPVSLQPKIQGYLAKMNSVDIEDMVCEALNLMYEALGQHADDPEFVSRVTEAAQEWAQECLNAEDTPQQMGWIGFHGQP